MKLQGFLIKNSFIVGTKLNVLKNFLLKIEREVGKHPFFFAANKILRWCRQGSDSRKAVNKSVRDISVSTAYCSISKSMVRPVRLWHTYFLFLKTNNKHFHFHATRQVELFMLHWFKAKFIRGIVFFYRHLILCNAISYATAERRVYWESLCNTSWWAKRR